MLCSHKEWQFSNVPVGTFTARKHAQKYCMNKLHEEPTCTNAGSYLSSPSWNLLFSSPHRRPLSLSTPFRRPLFSMARRERYGSTSSTGPNGTYLYTAYPSLPGWKLNKRLLFYYLLLSLSLEVWGGRGIASYAGVFSVVTLVT